MAEAADVIVSWYSDSTALQEVLKKLKRPFKHLTMPAGQGVSYQQQVEKYWPHAIRNLIMDRFGVSFRPLRVCVLGFSEGCQGVWHALRSADAKFLDSAIAIDGLSANWVPGSNKTKLETAYLTPWKAYGKLAMEEGNRVALITASSIIPPFPSVGLCADWVWQNTTGSVDSGGLDGPDEFYGEISPPYVNPEGCRYDEKGNKLYCWPERTYVGYPVKMYRQAGGLIVVDYYNLDPTGTGDHRLQAARVLPLMVDYWIVRRWNDIDPQLGSILV
jgi:hypothetical protein